MAGTNSMGKDQLIWHVNKFKSKSYGPPSQHDDWKRDSSGTNIGIGDPRSPSRSSDFRRCDLEAKRRGGVGGLGEQMTGKIRMS